MPVGAAADAVPVPAEAVAGQVFVATSSVEMRKSFDGLAEIVRAFLGHDPLCGSMFGFRNRSAERVKILWWDHNGLAIYYIRLEKGTFQVSAGNGKPLAIFSAELVKLLAGCAVQWADGRPS